jgi:rod shape-determining protein MreC
MLKRYASTFLLIFLLFLIPATLVSSIRNQLLVLIRPVGRTLVGQNVAIRNFSQNIRQISTLRQDREDLQLQVLSLQQQLAHKDDVLRENESLRRELGVTGVPKELPKVLAHVILQGSDPLDRAVTVDVGTEQGVLVGQPVVSQGILVGRVITARKNSAIIRYITSRESRIQALVSRNREKGLLIGDGNSVYLSDATQGVDIHEHDVVETSGLGGSLPQGIVIGQINQAVSKKSELSQKFSLKLTEDPSANQSLFILLSEVQ